MRAGWCARAELWGALAPPDAGRHRRPARLGGARRRARRAARLRAVLQSRILSRATRSRSRGLARRHVVPWRLRSARIVGDPAVRAVARASVRSRSLDLAAAVAPIGLFFGRIANFINGELWGRAAPDVPWAMVFPDGGPLPRHPSQLYEAFCEGLLLFIVLGRRRARASASAAGPGRRHLRARLRARAHRLRVLPRARSAARLPVRPRSALAAASPWACCCRCRWLLVGVVADRGSPRGGAAQRARRGAAPRVTAARRGLARPHRRSRGRSRVARYMALCLGHPRTATT